MGRSIRGIIALGSALLLGAWTPPADSPVADAEMRGDTARVRELLKQGADVNAAQGDGMTALHWAATRGDASQVAMLVYAGARVEQDLHRFHVAFTGCEEQRRQATLSANELAVAEGALPAASAATTATSGAPSAGCRSTRCARASGNGRFLGRSGGRIPTLATLILARKRVSGGPRRTCARVSVRRLTSAH